MAAFSKENSFTIVVRFFNMIDLYIYTLIHFSSEELREEPSILQKFYNSCKAVFSAERNQYLWRSKVKEM